MEKIKVITFKELNPQNLSEINFIVDTDAQVANLYLAWNTVTEDWKNSRKEHLKQLDSNFEYFLLAYDRNQIVGFHYIVISKWNHLRADIYTTWVDPKYRKQKIAQNLKAQGEAWAKARGVQFLVTAVDLENNPMNKLNLKQGFKPIRTHYLKEL